MFDSGNEILILLSALALVCSHTILGCLPTEDKKFTRKLQKLSNLLFAVETSLAKNDPAPEPEAEPEEPRPRRREAVLATRRKKELRRGRK